MQTKWLAISFLFVFSASINAESINLPKAAEQEHTYTIKKPSRGMTMGFVLEHYGIPRSQHGPAGKPAIIYWEYDQFTVYFEKRYVIHAVSKYKPKS